MLSILPKPLRPQSLGFLRLFVPHAAHAEALLSEAVVKLIIRDAPSRLELAGGAAAKQRLLGGLAYQPGLDTMSERPHDSPATACAPPRVRSSPERSWARRKLKR